MPLSPCLEGGDRGKIWGGLTGSHPTLVTLRWSTTPTPSPSFRPPAAPKSICVGVVGLSSGGTYPPGPPLPPSVPPGPPRGGEARTTHTWEAVTFYYLLKGGEKRALQRNPSPFFFLNWCIKTGCTSKLNGFPAQTCKRTKYPGGGGQGGLYSQPPFFTI